MTSIDLERAMDEPGCPICRLRQQTERRHLFHLLYENVNDGGTRLHLVRGMGLCPDHAWALQAIEQERWHDALGVGIIYEDLTRRVFRILTEYLHKNPPPQADWPSRLRTWSERSGALGRWLARRLLSSVPGSSLAARVTAVERCRVCHLVGSLEQNNLRVLLQKLADREFRDRYAASDGLCLPHLRFALANAEDEQTVRSLVEVTAAKLAPLVGDLGEYLRKHDWNNREEPKYPWEHVSPVRAMAFITGEAPFAEKRDIYRVRSEALAEYHRRANGPTEPNPARSGLLGDTDDGCDDLSGRLNPRG